MTRQWLAPFLLLTGCLFLDGCNHGDHDGPAGSSPGIHTTARPWIKEGEFRQDASLYATPDQTLILDLAPAAQGDSTLFPRKEIPYLLTDTALIGICIPAQEPHITELEIVSETGETMFRATPGSDCSPVELAAGTYSLQLVHDATTVDPPGQQVFIRRSNPVGVVADSATAEPDWDFFTFKGPNGKYVGLANPESNPGAVAATAERVTPATVFLTGRLGMLASPICTPETLSIAPFASKPNAGLAWYPPITGGSLFPDDELLAIQIDANAAAVTESCKRAGKNDFGACVVSFDIQDLGDNAIILLSTDYCVRHTGSTPIRMDEFGVLHINPDSAELPTEFTVDYTGYRCSDENCAASDLNLQEGQVAIFAECNFQGPAIVFAANVPDFSVYDDAPTDESGFVYGIKDNAAASIKPGPNTLVELWTEPAGSDSNTVYGIPGDTACLTGTPVAGQVSQMKIVSARQYIADTGGCNNCNLTGIDLSNADLSNKSFTSATFTNANLSNVSFHSAVLNKADFSGSETQLGGTDFSAATLECTAFNGTDLTAATFGTNTFTTDFSCRLGLASATLDYGAFPATDWRYFDMTSSTVNNVPDTLSSSTAPLDLSGAMLSNVGWLKGIALDYVNLGCYAGTGSSGAVCPTADGDKVCTTLTDTVLTSASLTNACLRSAQLQGALLEFANLDKSDLSDAQLLARTHGEPATLEGAFMRDVSIANADLTGVAMVNANFFSGSSTAEADSATLTSADLSYAYLAGANFHDAILRGTTWTGAVLAAANFNGADLSAETVGFTSKFDSAYMEGTVFTNATVTGADFTNSYWDLDNVSRNLNYLLPTGNLRFTGYWNNPATDECVQAAYPNTLLATAAPPQTDTSNTCPDGSFGPCTSTQWTSPVVPFSGTGSQTQGAIAPALPGNCTDIDILWTF